MFLTRFSFLMLIFRDRIIHMFLEILYNSNKYILIYIGDLMIKEFKDFILRGNVLDLAVGVIIGAAFTAIVTSLVDNLINPLIGLFVQDGALTQMSVKVAGATFTYGAFLNDVLNFLITAFVIFILIKTINKLFPKKEEEEEFVSTDELDTLREIRDLLKEKELSK